MFNKRKVLYSAMAVALMSSGGSAWAVTGLVLCNDTCDGEEDPISIAVESITKNTDIAVVGNKLQVVYTPATPINQDFYMTFTLSGGAEWGTSALNFDMWDSTDCTTSISPMGPSVVADDPSSVYFYINTKECPIDQAQWDFVTGADAGAGAQDDTAVMGAFTLSFDITDKNGTLGTTGSKIKLSVALELAANTNTKLDTAADKNSTDILTSAEGHLVSITTTTVNQAATPEIDVAQSSAVFVVQGTSTTTARLGSISLKNNTAVTVHTAEDVSDPWTFSADKVDSGTLIVSGAPFNASVTNEMVYIDNGNGVYDEQTDTFSGDFLATTVEDTSATWELSADEINGLNGSCSTTNGCEIVIEADGTTPIRDLADPPVGYLTIHYTELDKSVDKKLRHIKRNGTVCTLFNVPATGLLDDTSVRITNLSSKEGVVLGTLTDLKGKDIFTNKVLIGSPDAVITDTIGPNQTIRLSSQHLVDASEGTFTGRGVLTLSSDVPSGKMEIFGLVRNSLGGPLMNLSTGVSGKGCNAD